MSATSTTLVGRAAAEALMQDTCTIDRVTSRGAFDKVAGTRAADETEQVYTGDCKVKPRDNQDRVVQVGEQALSLWPFVVSVPVTAIGVDLDDVVTVTACELDPALVGAKLRVKQVIRGSYITARRLGCEMNAG